ncbi:unnamed protein product [Didymodactylos carnosus]|uniref:Uncharacterized protein n=1 Tax=Didymodactylos carnosus TaxID=1234261 RepID=A0A814TFY4_9BILA|nr:unnamed protein product [Didymodactylos carnosus]CAF1161668.1 unnamed protein product [Didymodactylos carnosus]CAF3754438.1 unnamed protein product [Didymodactylos carnosus]CAF3925310.1 unnamed protein product [Didymodactylos carnosus]
MQRKSRTKIRFDQSIINSNVVNLDETKEPYHCKGKFLDDFEALCRQAQISFIVPVVQRPRPPDENLPKTYSLKDNYDYFKPKIQVEIDNLDKQETITEIHIRAWKIDNITLDIFQQSFPTLEHLHTLNFWYTGLTDETVVQLATLLPKCPNLKTLILDSNPLANERYDVLLTDDTSNIVNLSLRHCCITEHGAMHIGNGLGNERRQNSKLQTLNLAYNKIGDIGAEQIAKGLKFNRTLLVLNLSNNDIGDNGAEKLAIVLSKFPLSREELIYRRQLLLDSTISESVPTLSARKIIDKDYVRRNSITSPPIQRKKSASVVILPMKKGKVDAAKEQSKGKKDDKTMKKGTQNIEKSRSYMTRANIAETKTTKGIKATDKNLKQSTAKGARSATQSETDRNNFLLDNDYYEKLQTLLKNRREPLFKGKEIEIESNGRETVGSIKSRC